MIPITVERVVPGEYPSLPGREIVVPSLKRRPSVKPPCFLRAFHSSGFQYDSAHQPLTSEAARRRAGPPPRAGPAQAAAESALDGRVHRSPKSRVFVFL